MNQIKQKKSYVNNADVCEEGEEKICVDYGKARIKKNTLSYTLLRFYWWF